MLSLEFLAAGALLGAITFYAVFGGADFGAGLWDLLASGPHKNAQRTIIAEAIGPIWEANHVWLILALVVLFNAFPPAFAAISTALFIPLTLMLVGIVLRGAAFVFRSYGSATDMGQRWWGRVFAIASMATPLMLGVCIGAISSGAIRVNNGIVTTGFFASWLAPFPIAVGVMTLMLFSYLAAVFLTVEAQEPALREDFRVRALWSAVAVGVISFSALGLAQTGAQRIWASLSTGSSAWPLQIGTGLMAVGAMAALWYRRFYFARGLAVAQVVLILWGWGAAQFPNLIAPDITILNSAAPAITLKILLTFLGLGALILFPSLYYLYRLFKGQNFPKSSETGSIK